MLRRLVAVALVAALAAGIVGCTPGGGWLERRVRLPETLPGDVPLPDGALLRAARVTGSDGITLVFETDEPAETVQERLRDRLASGGWVLLSEAAVESAVFASYGKGRRSLALSFSRTDGVTVVGLAYHQQESGREGDRG